MNFSKWDDDDGWKLYFCSILLLVYNELDHFTFTCLLRLAISANIKMSKQTNKINNLPLRFQWQWLGLWPPLLWLHLCCFAGFSNSPNSGRFETFALLNMLIRVWTPLLTSVFSSIFLLVGVTITGKLLKLFILFKLLTLLQEFSNWPFVNLKNGLAPYSTFRTSWLCFRVGIAYFNCTVCTV